MKDENVEWVKDWVKTYNDRDNHKLTPREIHQAAVIGNEMFHGNVGGAMRQRPGSRQLRN